jgi:hypothetical protein
MARLPDEPGVYLWVQDATVVYVGSTQGSLRKRLGPNGYATISAYNTLARETGRTNGGQQTNCRVNALANAALSTSRALAIWYRVTSAVDARGQERRWMAEYGKPEWNLRLESGE